MKFYENPHTTTFLKSNISTHLRSYAFLILLNIFDNLLFFHLIYMLFQLYDELRNHSIAKLHTVTYCHSIKFDYCISYTLAHFIWISFILVSAQK